MVMVSNISNVPLPTSYPTTPANTEVTARSRTNSLRSLALESLDDSNSQAASAPIQRRIPRTVGWARLGDAVTQFKEDTPGQFYEGDTDVPDNTPCTTDAASIAGTDDPATPRSQRSTAPDLPRVTERLEDLPVRLTSRFSSPTPSVFGGSSTDNQSTISEPLMIAARHLPGLTPRRSALRSPPNNSGSPSPPSRKSGKIEKKEPGIREYSDWANDIEADIQRDLARLANLAVDDHQSESETSALDHYHERLSRLLNHESLKFIYGEPEQSAMSSSYDLDAPLDPASRRDFVQLSRVVTNIREHINNTTEDDRLNVAHVNRLELQFKKRMEDSEAKLKKVVKENENMRREMTELQKMVMGKAMSNDSHDAANGGQNGGQGSGQRSPKEANTKVDKTNGNATQT